MYPRSGSVHQNEGQVGGLVPPAAAAAWVLYPKDLDKEMSKEQGKEQEQSKDQDQEIER